MQQRKFHKKLRSKQDKKWEKTTGCPVHYVLIHMDKIRDPVTSEDIALMINTNPVVVRRLSGAQTGGYHSFWKRAWRWLDTPEISRRHHSPSGFPRYWQHWTFSIGWATEHDKCQIEDAVNNEISDTLEEARCLITNRFAELTLDKLVPEVLKHK